MSVTNDKKKIERVEKEIQAAKNMESDLKLNLNFFEYITMWLPFLKRPKNKVFTNVKFQIFNLSQGKGVIKQRLDMRNLLKSLNEIEKLKLMLFDEDQYFIFQHIPKPILFDENMLYDRKKRSKKDKEGEDIDCILSKNRSFWTRRSPEDEEAELSMALQRIKNKQDLNIIDQRLIAIIDTFGQQGG